MDNRLILVVLVACLGFGGWKLYQKMTEPAVSYYTIERSPNDCQSTITIYPADGDPIPIPVKHGSYDPRKLIDPTGSALGGTAERHEVKTPDYELWWFSPPFTVEYVSYKGEHLKQQH